MAVSVFVCTASTKIAAHIKEPALIRRRKSLTARAMEDVDIAHYNRMVTE